MTGRYQVLLRWLWQVAMPFALDYSVILMPSGAGKYRAYRGKHVKLWIAGKLEYIGMDQISAQVVLQRLASLRVTVFVMAAWKKHIEDISRSAVICSDKRMMTPAANIRSSDIYSIETDNFKCNNLENFIRG